MDRGPLSENGEELPSGPGQATIFSRTFSKAFLMATEWPNSCPLTLAKPPPTSCPGQKDTGEEAQPSTGAEATLSLRRLGTEGPQRCQQNRPGFFQPPVVTCPRARRWTCGVGPSTFQEVTNSEFYPRPRSQPLSAPHSAGFWAAAGRGQTQGGPRSGRLRSLAWHRARGRRYNWLASGVLNVKRYTQLEGPWAP